VVCKCNLPNWGCKFDKCASITFLVHEMSIIVRWATLPILTPTELDVRVHKSVEAMDVHVYICMIVYAILCLKKTSEYNQLPYFFCFFLKV
jgi:hypothetical protein